MKCSVCSKQCRATSIVHVPAGDGAALVRKRACQTCCSRALLILPREPSARCKCGEPATVCHVCAGEKERRGKKEGADVAAIVKRLKGMARGYYADAEGNQNIAARVEGIESAIELLESGRW